jgi:hypothetical protein
VAGGPVMNNLHHEILRRFPELAQDVGEGEEDMFYLTMSYLVTWLDAKGKAGFDSTTVQRVVDFAKWCESQPRGATCTDDTYTVLVVGLYEGLFHHEHTKSLIPHLMSKEDMEANEEYLITWVGRDNYKTALEQF